MTSPATIGSTPDSPERDPGREPEQQVDRAVADAAPGEHPVDGEQRDADQQRQPAHVAAVEDGDDREPDQVVDDRERQQVGAHPVGQPLAADQGQRAERERGVGRHRRAPAVRGAAAGVDREVDRDRHQHAAEPGQERQRHPAAHPQLAHVELAARLQADDEEEQRHQPGVHELPQVHRMPWPADPRRTAWSTTGVS